ncbi:hypothetical protein JAAARDRAFT_39249 [Jaapia argillacea MUCL 33604]|uniref:F-box domain-containing protein n=1 Tax=Jaapia argillacea MUCL 33604 TaxID=933084 RepID=A0A067PQH3_9AGAM|nr:hypothetical protein JAAARDRAFT_39249 [Jaapia argillacea MUCL 33604]
MTALDEKVPSTISASKRCPPEIWHRIFSEIGPDNETGRALSLVSQSFNRVSEPVLFRSLFLVFDIRALERLDEFCQMLERKPPWVHHLFLDFYNSDPRDVNVSRLWKVQTTEDEDFWKRVFDRMSDLVNRLLAIVDPTLTILTIFLETNTMMPRISVPLAHLRDLTFYVSRPLILLSDHPPDMLPSAPFPSLERLHVAYKDEVYRSGIVAPHIDTIAQYAPNLTHIYLSGLRLDHAYIKISQAFGPLETGSNSFSLQNKMRLPSSLQRFIIGLDVSTRFREAYIARWGLEASTVGNGLLAVRYVRLKKGEVEGEFCLEEAKQEWVDRIQGAPILWEEDVDLDIEEEKYDGTVGG